MKLGDSKRTFNVASAALLSAATVMMLWGVPGPAGGCGGGEEVDDPAAVEETWGRGSEGFEQSAYVMTADVDADGGVDGGAVECDEVVLLPRPGP